MPEVRERPEESTGVYGLVYQQALSSWSRQEARLDELRARTGTLLAAVTVATSFLGAAALGKPSDGRDLAALALFLFAVCLCLVVLFPLPVWRFNMAIDVFLDEIAEREPRLPLSEIQRAASLHISWALKHNEKLLHWMFIVFEWAAIVVAVEIVLWASAFIRA